MTFLGAPTSADDDFYLGQFEAEPRAARIGYIPSAKKKRKEFKPFTSTLSGACLLGIYIGWASIFFF
jgi:hypothetical protein